MHGNFGFAAWIVVLVRSATRRTGGHEEMEKSREMADDGGWWGIRRLPLAKRAMSEHIGVRMALSPIAQ